MDKLGLNVYKLWVKSGLNCVSLSTKMHNYKAPRLPVGKDTILPNSIHNYLTALSTLITSPSSLLNKFFTHNPHALLLLALAKKERK